MTRQKEGLKMQIYISKNIFKILLHQACIIQLTLKMIGKQEAFIMNSFKKNQASKKIYELSYTENRLRCYFNQFWEEQTAEFIKHVQQDHSNQIREYNCKEKTINVSSIIKNNQADSSSQISFSNILHAVGQQQKVKYQSNPQRKAIETLQQKNMYSMNKKVQSQLVGMRKEKDIKLEVKVNQKKQVPKKQEQKVESFSALEIKIDKKIELATKKVDVQPKVSIKESNEVKIKTQKSQNSVVIQKNETQFKKHPQNITIVKQQFKLQDVTQSIKKNDLQKPILPSEVPKKSNQLPKAYQSQEQEVIDEHPQSYFHLLSKTNLKLQNLQQVQVQNYNRIDSDLSQTRNCTNNEPKSDDYIEEYINQSAQRFIKKPDSSNEQPALSLDVQVQKDKKLQMIENNSPHKQRLRTYQNPNKPNDEQIIGEVNKKNQELAKSDEAQVQEYIDQNHFVTCITDTQLQNQNPTIQFSSKMSGIQDYQSYSNVAILQQQQPSEMMILDQSVDKIVEDFMNQLETQGVILNEKIIKIKQTVWDLKQANQKLQVEKEELIQQNEQLNTNLIQANRKNNQLLQYLERQKKQNFDYKIKIQKMEATIKELQDKDIFNNSQQINLSQHIKRNRSEQALLQKQQTSSNSNQIKQQKNKNYSDEESEKNPSDLQDNYKQVKKDESEEQSQKNQSDLEQQSKQNNKNAQTLQANSKIQQKKEASRSSSKC